MKQKKQCRYCGSYSSDSLRRCCNAGHVEDRDLAEVEAAGRRAAERTQTLERMKGGNEPLMHDGKMIGWQSKRSVAPDGVVILRASVELRSARQNGHCASDYAAVFARVVTACEKAAEKALVDAMAKEHRAAKDAGIAVFIAKPVVEKDVKRILVPERPCQKAAVAMDYMLRDKQVLKPKARAEKHPIAYGGRNCACMRCGTQAMLRTVHWGQHDCKATVCAHCMGRLGGDWSGLTFPWAHCKGCGHAQREQSTEVPRPYTTGIYHPSCYNAAYDAARKAEGIDGLQGPNALAINPKAPYAVCKGCGGSREVQGTGVLSYDDGVYHPWCRRQKEKATAAAPNTKLCVGCTLPGDRSQNLVMYADGAVDRLYHPRCFSRKQGWSE